jgi:hypothetical protein
MSRLLTTEGAGNAGRSLHPQPRVRNETKHTSVVTTGSDGFNRHSPRNGFTAYFALSPAIGLVVTVVRASSRRLDASFGASEPHDFAVRVSTIRPSRAARVHRIPPHVDDVRNAPLLGRDGANQ